VFPEGACRARGVTFQDGNPGDPRRDRALPDSVGTRSRGGFVPLLSSERATEHPQDGRVLSRVHGRALGTSRGDVRQGRVGRPRYRARAREVPGGPQRDRFRACPRPSPEHLTKAPVRRKRGRGSVGPGWGPPSVVGPSLRAAGSFRPRCPSLRGRSGGVGRAPRRGERRWASSHRSRRPVPPGTGAVRRSATR